MTKAVMTIHGFLTDINDFGILYDSLQKDYDEIYKCKVPGHNDEIDFKKFTVEATIQTVLDGYDMLRQKHDQVDVVGFSMGGALTTYLCTQRDVHRAVLIAPANRYYNYASTTRAIRFYYKQYADVLRNATGTIGDRIREADKFMKDYRSNNLKSVKIALMRLLPNLSVHTYTTFRDIVKQCNAALEEKGEKGVKVPTLLQWGELDELVPRTSKEYIAPFFDDITVKTYPDIGHAMLMTNRAEALIADIRKFLVGDWTYIYRQDN